MAKQPFISHVVNGYSRYDVPESKAFTCSPGPLYPVRIDFINARDRVTISQGVDFRSNPLAVPTFNPYTVRLHRFWVPLQLYHPEMRTNSSLFDMNNLSVNWIPSFADAGIPSHGNLFGTEAPYENSLFSWLRVATTPHVSKLVSNPLYSEYDSVSLPSATARGFYGGAWSNADTYLAYWDIVRNYYSYSQWSVYSFAWPSSWFLVHGTGTGEAAYSYGYASAASYFSQRIGNLQFLDSYFESQFYPSSVPSSNNTYNRSNLFKQIIHSDFSSTASDNSMGPEGDGYPVANIILASGTDLIADGSPVNQFSIAGTGGASSLWNLFHLAHPLAIAPSSPDRFSRLIPIGSDSSVSMTGVSTIPQLAVASRLQEYRDLLGAGGNRFSDWLETFFASKIEHVDRPKLLFSASQTINAQIIMNQTGENGKNSTLGAQGGSVAFNSVLGREQSYYFKEPGYLIDMLSVRPVYYWSGVRPDYLDYRGADYFNPLYNDIGYQSLNPIRLGTFSTGRPTDAGTPIFSFANEPCFNEYRSSYDEVLGMFIRDDSNKLSSYWVQQRNFANNYFVSSDGSARYHFYPHMLFVDMLSVNSPFASNVEDNFFVNLSYSIKKKNLVNKTFATRLSNR